MTTTLDPNSVTYFSSETYKGKMCYHAEIDGIRHPISKADYHKMVTVLATSELSDQFKRFDSMDDKGNHIYRYYLISTLPKHLR